MCTSFDKETVGYKSVSNLMKKYNNVYNEFDEDIFLQLRKY